MIHNYNLLSEPALGNFISDYDDRILLGDHLSLQELSFLGIDLQARRILFDPTLQMLDVIPRRELASDYLSLKRIQILDTLVPWIDQLDPENYYGLRGMIHAPIRNLALVVNQIYKTALRIRDNAASQALLNCLQNVLPQTALAELQERHDPDLEQIQDLFHLRLSDLAESSAFTRIIDVNRKEMIRFVSECMTMVPPRVIAPLVKTYPLIQDLLHRVHEGLSDWKVQIFIGYSEFDRGALRDQLYSLQCLSALFLELRPDYDTILREFTAEDIPYLSLPNLMEGENYTWAIEVLRRQAEMKSLTLPDLGPTKPCPVRSTALMGQISLFTDYRKWLNLFEQGQLIVTRVADSPTHVVNHYKTVSGESLGYIKWDKTIGVASASILESLMWQVAEFMGMETFFTPTRQVQLKNSNAHGSFQPSVKGTLFNTYKQDNPSHPIGREQLIDAVFICLALGMYDAHRKNIMIGFEGNPIFFDNSRSLCHGNGQLVFGFNGEDSPYLHTSFRCALLDLQEAMVNLTEDEKIRIKKAIEDFESRMTPLQKYFESKGVQKKLKSLPIGWFNTEWVLKAMRERLVNMKNALERNSNLTLVEFSVQTIPGYSFTVALLYLHFLVVNHPMVANGKRGDLHQYVGTSILKYINYLTNKGYDIGYLYDLCSSSALTLDEILNLVHAYYIAIRDSGPGYIPTGADRVSQQIISGSFPDFKDISHLYSVGYCEKYNWMKFKEMIKDENVIHVKSLRDVFWYNREVNNPFLLKRLDDFFLVYDTPTGRRLKYIDFKTEPGYLMTIRQNQKVKVAFADIFESIKTSRGDESCDDIALLPTDWKNVKLSDEKPFALFQQKNRNLAVITKRVNGTLALMNFEPDPNAGPGRYLCNGKSRTISEVLQRLKLV